VRGFGRKREVRGLEVRGQRLKPKGYGAGCSLEICTSAVLPLTSDLFLMLKISQTEYDLLRRHGEETYPDECCGVLLGHFDDGGRKTVTRTARCGNVWLDSLHNRYSIDPKELIRIQREGRERGEEIVGFYHSHPNHPARWSETDLAEAHWIGCSYVITGVENGRAAATNSFELSGVDEAEKRFVDEVVEVGG